jgi:hypothetical protein
MDKVEEILKNLNEGIEKLENKDFAIYFFVIDSETSPIASISYIYEQVKILTEAGYNAKILHEKNSYRERQLPFIKDWLGEEYFNLPHSSIEDKSVNVNATDFIVIPELFANVMEQIVRLQTKRIVLCQSYDYITETLQAGKSWSDYNITNCITTTEQQKEHIQSLFLKKLEIDVIPVSVDDTFQKPTKPKSPIITILTRDQRDTVKIFKSFYLKYPHLKWVTFRDMRGMTKKVFAKALSESCVSVWVDDIAGCGTFPLESMKSGTAVIGKIPNLMNNWIGDKNGIWVDNVNVIPDLLAKFVQAWLEDSPPDEIYENMDETVKNFTTEKQKEKTEEVYGRLVNERIEEFKSTLEKYKNNNVEEKVNQ